MAADCIVVMPNKTRELNVNITTGRPSTHLQHVEIQCAINCETISQFNGEDYLEFFRPALNARDGIWGIAAAMPYLLSGCRVIDVDVVITIHVIDNHRDN